MATDRYNDLETELLTALQASAGITAVFTTGHIERRFRDDINNYYANECPFLAFEVVGSDANEEVVTNDRYSPDLYRDFSVIFEIITSAAQMDTARQNAKTYLSLLEDFLHSSAWSRSADTGIGTARVTSSKSGTAFRGYAYLETVIQVNLVEA